LIMTPPLKVWLTTRNSIFALVVASTLTPEDSALAQSVRDSAGIRIVSNTKPTWTQAQTIRLAPTPVVLAGNGDGEAHEFTHIVNTFTLAGGRLAVVDDGSNEIRLFDAKGAHVKTFGRKGDGPGEFRNIERAERLAGDTIAIAHDRTIVSRFTADGVYIGRSDDKATPRKLTEPALVNITMILNGNSRVLSEWPFRHPTGPVASEFDAKARFRIIGGDGAEVADLGNLNAMRASSDRNGLTKPWLGAEAVYTTDGNQFIFGYGTQYSLARYAKDGKPNLIIRRAWNASPITKKDHEAFADAWLERWGDKKKTSAADKDKERREFLADAYFKTLPAFSAVLMDKTGRIWVRSAKAIDGAAAGSLNGLSMGPSSWSVFSTAGVWLGEVAMPARFAPTEIGTDFVLGTGRDADGIPIVVRYSLHTGR
jgi:hypothetical protein